MTAGADLARGSNFISPIHLILLGCNLLLFIMLATGCASQKLVYEPFHYDFETIAIKKYALYGGGRTFEQYRGLMLKNREYDRNHYRTDLAKTLDGTLKAAKITISPAEKVALMDEVAATVWEHQSIPRDEVERAFRESIQRKARQRFSTEPEPQRLAEMTEKLYAKELDRINRVDHSRDWPNNKGAFERKLLLEAKNKAIFILGRLESQNGPLPDMKLNYKVSAYVALGKNGVYTYLNRWKTVKTDAKGQFLIKTYGTSVEVNSLGNRAYYDVKNSYRVSNRFNALRIRVWKKEGMPVPLLKTRQFSFNYRERKLGPTRECYAIDFLDEKWCQDGRGNSRAIAQYYEKGKVPQNCDVVVSRNSDKSIIIRVQNGELAVAEKGTFAAPEDGYLTSITLTKETQKQNAHRTLFVKAKGGRAYFKLALWVPDSLELGSFHGLINAFGTRLFFPDARTVDMHTHGLGLAKLDWNSASDEEVSCVRRQFAAMVRWLDAVDRGKYGIAPNYRRTLFAASADVARYLQSKKTLSSKEEKMRDKRIDAYADLVDELVKKSADEYDDRISEYRRKYVEYSKRVDAVDDPSKRKKLEGYLTYIAKQLDKKGKIHMIVEGNIASKLRYLRMEFSETPK